jgi:hypothetical protein
VENEETFRRIIWPIFYGKKLAKEDLSEGDSGLRTRQDITP